MQRESICLILYLLAFCLGEIEHRTRFLGLGICHVLRVRLRRLWRLIAILRLNQSLLDEDLAHCLVNFLAAGKIKVVHHLVRHDRGERRERTTKLACKLRESLYRFHPLSGIARSNSDCNVVFAFLDVVQDDGISGLRVSYLLIKLLPLLATVRPQDA